MARKKSPGCGTVIIGLIALAMAATYWYVLVAIGFAALAIWVIVKLTRSWSTPETPGKNLEFQGVTVSASIADTPTPVIEQDIATVRAAAEVAIKQQAAEKAAIRERVAQVNAEIEQILATEKAAASAVITVEKAADVAVAANPITDTPAPIVISATEANTLINHCTPQNNPELLEKTLDRNNTNMKVDHVNAVIGKDPASEKAAAGVAMKIINRLGAALVDAEIQRTLDAKKTALLERVSQVDAEIEKVLAAEKKVHIIKRLLAVLECIRTQRILDSEKVAMRERVDLGDSEIGRVLSTENTIDIPAEFDKSEKQIEKRIGHFIDNGNGTVTDTLTELTWMRYAMGQAKDDIAKNTYTWDEVMTFRYSFAGHDDWRLPTRDELKSILDPSRENPAINTEAFPQTVNSWFWSSTPFLGRSGYAWVISFHNGRNHYLKRNTENFVRLVRGGQNVGLLDQKSTEHLVTLAATAAVSCENPKTPSEIKVANDLATPVDNDTDKPIKKRIGHFIDNGDGTVTDPITKLTWMRCVVGQTWDGTSCQGIANTFSLNQAIAIRLTFAGYDDWRLPTRDELESIVDLNRNNPAINIDALPQIAGSWFWSSSLNTNHTHSAWSTNFESGHVISLCSGYVRGDDNLSVRLVRGDRYVKELDVERVEHVRSPEVTQIIDSEAAASFDNFETEVAEAMKQYDFVLINKLEQLKTGDQWFEETTQKRRLRTSSDKLYAWLLPFMPFEIAKRCEIQNVVNWGLNSVSVIPKQLRVLIRERRKLKEPYDDLLRALYGSCVLTDFVKTLAFEGPIGSVACNVDIRELQNICIDYDTLGYHYIEALLKTDVKWLIEAFGAPAAHQTIDALWPNIRINAISRYCWEELRIRNERWRNEMSIVEWLRDRVSSNLKYYRLNWEQRIEWLGRDDEWLARKIASEPQAQTARSVKQKMYAIPAQSPQPEREFTLDMSSIETKLAETVAVSAILKDIFSEDAPVPSQTAVPDSTATETSIVGLDTESFSFMQALASKHIWTRGELEKLADLHSLMLDGTLDSINDAAYDHFGGPFFEGDDPIEINTEFAKEITA